MNKIPTDCFLSIAKAKGDESWHILIMGDALHDGLIPSSYIQKFKKIANSFKIKTCKMRILFVDSQLEVAMAGKNLFTLDEVEVYIHSWKIRSKGAIKVKLDCECGDDDCDGTECDFIPEEPGQTRPMTFKKK